MISKDDYILRSFSKIKHKSWELYVITRIIHLLDDPDLEFICQQLIKTSEGRRYFADLCFPSLKIYIEIDELHHVNQQNQIEDKFRKTEIIDVTNYKEYRIPIFNSQNKLRELKEINDEILSIVELLKSKKNELEKTHEFIPWNYENKFSPEPHISNGYIDINDNVSFLTHRDAMKCFGYTGGHFQRATWKVKNTDSRLWFPKLYKNNMWDNSLSENSKIITMKLDDGSNLKDWYLQKRSLEDTPYGSRQFDAYICFAHYSNHLGQTVYKFLGEFKISITESDDFSVIFKRTKTRINLLS